MVHKDSDKHRGRTQIGDLEVNRETIQDLTDEQISKIQGGVFTGVDEGKDPGDTVIPRYTIDGSCACIPRLSVPQSCACIPRVSVGKC